MGWRSPGRSTRKSQQIYRLQAVPVASPVGVRLRVRLARPVRHLEWVGKILKKTADGLGNGLDFSLTRSSCALSALHIIARKGS